MSDIGAKIDDAVTKSKVGKHAEAADILQRLLGTRQPWEVKWQTDYARAQAELGTSCYKQKQFREAEFWHREALKNSTVINGLEDSANLDYMQRLALTLGMAVNSAGDNMLAEAVSLMIRGLPQIKARYGEDHPETLNALTNYAVLLTRKQEFKEAEAIHADVLQKRLIRADDQIATNISVNGVAFCLVQQGEHEMAEKLYLESISHIQVDKEKVSSMGNLALLYRSQRRYDEAENLLQELMGLPDYMFDDPAERITKDSVAQEIGFLQSIDNRGIVGPWIVDNKTRTATRRPGAF